MLDFKIPALPVSPLPPWCCGLAMDALSLCPSAAPADAAWEEVGEKRWSFLLAMSGQ